MGALLDSSLMLVNIVTQKLTGRMFDWMQLISGDVETAQTDIAALQGGTAGAPESVVQTEYDELAASNTFAAGTFPVSVTVTTATVNGILEIDWSGSCVGNTASTFYVVWLQVDGVTVQAGRFTLDAASASFAFSFGGKKRMTGVAPGAHVCRLNVQPGGGATMAFTLPGSDHCEILAKEIRP